GPGASLHVPRRSVDRRQGLRQRRAAPTPGRSWHLSGLAPPPQPSPLPPQPGRAQAQAQSQALENRAHLRLARQSPPPRRPLRPAAHRLPRLLSPRPHHHRPAIFMKPLLVIRAALDRGWHAPESGPRAPPLKAKALKLPGEFAAANEIAWPL